MHQQSKSGGFEQLVLPHLDAAYNLARWLSRREHEAEDIVQEAFLRAFNAFDQFHGGDARAWLLTIVRNTCYTWMSRRRDRTPASSFDETLHDVAAADSNPVEILQQRGDHEALRRAVQALPVEFREALILREFEGLSYQEIAQMTQVPVGTVMSRLSRARHRLEQTLGPQLLKET